MTEFKIDLGSALGDVEKQARLYLETGLISAARSIVTNLLHDGRYNNKEGLAHEILRKKIEDYVLSNDFSKKIDNTIQNLASEEIERAVRALLNSKARKELFSATYPAQE